MEETMTFNDLPMVLQQVLNKIERLEQVLDGIKEEMTKNHKPKDHVPMTLDEACDFLKMKKSTMYYHIERGNIPATRTGKNYLLFKDELIHWCESGRKNPVSMTPEERNASIRASHKRKALAFHSY